MGLSDTEIRRIEEVEELMSSGIQLRRVGPLVAKKYGVTRRQGSRYVRAVLDRWKTESESGRVEKRGQIEATLWALYRAATRRKKASVKRGKGGVEEIVEHPDPDARAALEVLRTIALMNGLIEPEKAAEVHMHLTVDQRVLAISTGLKAHYFGDTVAPELPANTIDTQGETTEGNETP